MSLGRFQNRNLPGMNNFRQHGVEDELDTDIASSCCAGAMFMWLSNWLPEIGSFDLCASPSLCVAIMDSGEDPGAPDDGRG